MKNQLTLLTMTLALALLLALSGCSATLVDAPDAPAAPPTAEEEEPAAPETEQRFDLALVTDANSIDDNSFNEGSWAGLTKFAEENGLTCQYYQPVEASDAAYLDCIDAAVAAGVGLVICPGNLLEAAVFEAQYLYPEVCFVLLDGEPHSADYSVFATESNTCSILFEEQQAGFLAGYAAVKEGYTKLGFIGGMTVGPVVNFGAGYIQGAELAATELGVEVELLYAYSGNFLNTPETQNLAGTWFTNGTEIIFACNGGGSAAVMAAAEAAGAKVIGVDVDQSQLSETVVVSALKRLTGSVYEVTANFHQGRFPGGQTLYQGAEAEGVALTMESSRMVNFKRSDYKFILDRLISGEASPLSCRDPEADLQTLVTGTALTLTLVK